MLLILPARPTEPVEGETFKPNAIEVSVRYLKDARVRGYYISVWPIEQMENGGTGRLLMDERFKGHTRLLEATQRLNQKKLDGLGEVVKDEIAWKAGNSWAVVSAVLAASKMELIESTK